MVYVALQQLSAKFQSPAKLLLPQFVSALHPANRMAEAEKGRAVKQLMAEVQRRNPLIGSNAKALSNIFHIHIRAILLLGCISGNNPSDGSQMILHIIPAQQDDKSSDAENHVAELHENPVLLPLTHPQPIAPRPTDVPRIAVADAPRDA